MLWKLGRHWRNEECVHNIISRPGEEKKPLARSVCGLKDRFKMDLRRCKKKQPRQATAVSVNAGKR